MECLSLSEMRLLEEDGWVVVGKGRVTKWLGWMYSMILLLVERVLPVDVLDEVKYHVGWESGRGLVSRHQVSSV